LVHFPFLKHEAFRRFSNAEINLYKFTFAPDIQPQTLAIIGCFIGAGPHPPMTEMQCRVATKVFKVRAVRGDDDNARVENAEVNTFIRQK